MHINSPDCIYHFRERERAYGALLKRPNNTAQRVVGGPEAVGASWISNVNREAFVAAIVTIPGT